MKRALLLSILILVGVSCKRDNPDVPYVSFDFTINVNEPAYFDLQAVGGYEYVVGGSLGLIVYRNSFNEFTALERHSPYNVGENCQVDVLEDGITVEDPCSGSQWVITDGSLLQGPAARSLVQYNTIWNDPFLRIYN